MNKNQKESLVTTVGKRVAEIKSVIVALDEMRKVMLSIVTANLLQYKTSVHDISRATG